jgi:hypothetical protein
MVRRIPASRLKALTRVTVAGMRHWSDITFDSCPDRTLVYRCQQGISGFDDITSRKVITPVFVMMQNVVRYHDGTYREVRSVVGQGAD